MKDLELNEVEQVSGGVVWVPIVVGVIVVGAIIVGIYNGYADAAAAGKKK